MLPYHSLILLAKKMAPNKVYWDEKWNQAFSKLKELLCSYPIIQSPDFSHAFTLQNDSFNQGVGAILS